MFLSDRSGMRHTSEVRPGGYPEGRGGELQVQGPPDES